MFKQVTDKYGKDVMPLYKPQPPLIESETGHGFEGTVLWDSKEDKIMCNECGEWFNFLNQTHLKIHDLIPTEYKEKHGLFKKTPLMNQRMLENKRAIMKENFEDNKEKILSNLRAGVYRGGSSKAQRNAQTKNRNGTCDAQLKARFEKRMEELGRLPKSDELAFRSTMFRRYGTYGKALEIWGYGEFYKGGGKFTEQYSKQDCIDIMLDFKKEMGREMYISDLWKMGKSKYPFIRQFGSWSKAKEIAYN